MLEKNPHVAQVHFWDDIFFQFLPQRGSSMAIRIARSFRKNRESMRALRARRYDAVVNARAYPPSSNVAWREIGGALIAFDISEQSFLADYWADYGLDAEEWKNYANLLAPLGIDPASVAFSEEIYNNDAPNPMTGTGGAAPGKYVVISPVSFNAERQWKAEYWKVLIAALAARGGRAWRLRACRHRGNISRGSLTARQRMPARRDWAPHRCVYSPTCAFPRSARS